jgi:2-polyprenyl-3-methyl-5-hydroxy-6-metoxy-1,4-benzoquinol methylase
MTTETTNTAEAARALKVRHRAMWAFGDYPAVVTDLVSPLGPVLAGAVGIRPGDRVLDVAAGSGNAAIPAAEAGASVVASDLTPELLEAGQREAARRGTRLEWRQADAEDLPFADGEFDMASAIEVLEHVPDPEHTLSEMARVAGRSLLVSVPREPLWRGLNVARGAYIKDLGNTPGHVNHWSKRAFVALLSRHGEVVEARSPFPWTMLLVRL